MDAGGQGQQNDRNSASDLKMDAIINTPRGQIRSGEVLSGWEIAFISTAVFFRVLAMVITIYRMTVLDTASPDFGVCIILLINSVLCIFYVIDAVFKERGSGMIVVFIALTLIVVYVIINYVREKNELNLARMCISIIDWLLVIGLGLKISVPTYYNLLSRVVFRVVGADVNVQRMYIMVLWLQDLLKFDLHIKASMLGFIVSIPNNVANYDIAILSVGGIIAVFTSEFGPFVFWREIKAGAILLCLYLPLEPIYCGFKIHQAENHLESYSEVAICLITCGVAIIFLRAAILFFGILVYRNFGKGLKEIVQNRPGESTQLINANQRATSNPQIY